MATGDLFLEDDMPAEPTDVARWVGTDVMNAGPIHDEGDGTGQIPHSARHQPVELRAADCIGI